MYSSLAPRNLGLSSSFRLSVDGTTIDMSLFASDIAHHRYRHIHGKVGILEYLPAYHPK
jgi:hypothetical protein